MIIFPLVLFHTITYPILSVWGCLQIQVYSVMHVYFIIIVLRVTLNPDPGFEGCHNKAKIEENQEQEAFLPNK